MSPNQEQLVERLLAERVVGVPAAGAPQLYSVLINPDGPEAATTLTYLSEENERLKAERGWQPIGTAPRKGLVLVTGHWPEDNEEVSGWAWWNLGTCTDIGVFGDWDSEVEPTHWMPLPEPPARSALKGEG